MNRQLSFGSPTLLIPLVCILLASFSACSSDGGPGPDLYDPQDLEGVSITYITLPLRDNFAGMTFGDDGVILVCGYEGSIIRSSDEGATWSDVFRDSTLSLEEVVGTSTGTYYAVGSVKRTVQNSSALRPGVILRSQDNGMTWEMVYQTDKTVELTGVDCLDNGLVIAAGYGIILRSENFGQDWNLQEIPNLGGLFQEVHILDQATRFVSVGSPKFLRSIDSPEWSVSTMSEEMHVYFFDPVDRDLIFGAGRPALSKSVDGGKTWQTIPDSPDEIFALKFFDASNGIALGRGFYSGGDLGTHLGSFFITTDGGATWRGTKEVSTGTATLSQMFRDIAWPVRDRCYGLTATTLCRFDLDGE